MNEKTSYKINQNTKYEYLELIDVQALVAECKEQWFNQTLCHVNDSVVRLGILHGEFHWHKHDEEDEFFFVLNGEFLIDLEDRIVKLGVHQGFTIPRGLIHRTRAPEPTVVLMVENGTIIPTGN